MVFSLSRCSNKAKDLPAKSKSKSGGHDNHKPRGKTTTTAFTSTSKRNLSRIKRRPLPRPPIPSFPNFSQLERLEREFLEDSKPHVKAETKTSGFSSSDDEDSDDDAILKAPVFQKKSAVSTSANKSETSHGKEVERQHLPIRSPQDQQLPLQEEAIGVGFDYGDEAGQPQPSRTKDNKGTDISTHMDVVCIESESASKTEPSQPPANKQNIAERDQIMSTTPSVATREETKAIVAPQTIQQCIDIVFRDITDVMGTSVKEVLQQVQLKLKRPLSSKEKADARAYLKNLVKQHLKEKKSRDEKENDRNASNIQQDCQGRNAATTPSHDAIKEGALSTKRKESSIAMVHTQIQTPGSVDEEYEFYGILQIPGAPTPPQIAMKSEATKRQKIDEPSDKDVVDPAQAVRTPTCPADINSGDATKILHPNDNESGQNCSLQGKKTISHERDTSNGPVNNNHKEIIAPTKEAATRKRGRPTKNSEANPVAIESNKVENLPMTDGVVKLPTRRRARKGTCALCTTCPCNNKGDEGDGGVFTTLARSDVAIEKALIRRVQKMEKTCELHEGRMDAIKRTLKQHRRDMYRKKENAERARASSSNTKLQEYEFLPDVDQVEQEELDRKGLNSGVAREIVQNAQLRLFPEVPPPCKQGTLSQWLGCPSSKEPDKKAEPIGVVTIQEEMEEKKVGDNGKTSTSAVEEDASLADAQDYVKYSKGIEYENQVNRQAWNTTGEPSESKAIPLSFSLWKTLSDTRAKLAHDSSTVANLEATQFTQVMDTDEDCHESPQCPWDDLFEQEDTTAGAGIDQLIGLFGQKEDATVDNSSLAPETVSLSHLSQSGHSKALEVIESVEKDSQRLKTLQKSCPNWKENVAFSMKQKEPSEIRTALQNIQKQREQMLEFQRRIMAAWETQDTTLQVFEHSLLTSLQRLIAQGSPVGGDIGGSDVVATDDDGGAAVLGFDYE